MPDRPHLNYGLGIDVGTTFTAAATIRDGHVEAFLHDTSEPVIPSVVFASGEEILYGGQAERRGAAQPDGLAREFKRRVGDPVPIVLSGTPYHAHRLIALVANWVVERVRTQLDAPPTGIAVTHPANWTKYQLELLQKGLDGVGLDAAHLISEPAAAAWDYANTTRLEAGALVLVYDLGGGTFDVALLRLEEDRFEHAVEPAGIERLGGIDFDESVFQFALHTVPSATLERARHLSEGRAHLAILRRVCVAAKESLSSNQTADIPIVLPGHTSSARLTRREFEQRIRPMVLQTLELVSRVLERAQIRPEALDAALLIGGSSRVPLVPQMLSEHLGIPVRVDAHPKLVVAKGAARRAAERNDGSSRRRHPVERHRGFRIFGRAHSSTRDRHREPTSLTPELPGVADAESSGELVELQSVEPPDTVLASGAVAALELSEPSGTADEVLPVETEGDVGLVAPPAAPTNGLAAAAAVLAPSADEEEADQPEPASRDSLAEAEPHTARPVADRSPTVEPTPAQSAMEKLIVATPGVTDDPRTDEERPEPVDMPGPEAENAAPPEQFAPPPVISTPPVRTHRRGDGGPTDRTKRRRVGAVAAVVAAGAIVAAVIAITARGSEDGRTARQDRTTEVSVVGGPPAVDPTTATTAAVGVAPTGPIETAQSTVATTETTAVTTTVFRPPPVPTGYQRMDVDLESLVVSLGVPDDWIKLTPEDVADPAVREEIVRQIGGEQLLVDTNEEEVPHIFSTDGEGANISITESESFPTLESLSTGITNNPGFFISDRGRRRGLGDGAIWVRYYTDPALTADEVDTIPKYGQFTLINFGSIPVVAIVKSLHELQVVAVGDTILDSMALRSTKPGAASRQESTQR
jgi:actin-like ATPase involved in cell morphogenesis